jgi:hypothetical protein
MLDKRLLGWGAFFYFVLAVAVNASAGRGLTRYEDSLPAPRLLSPVTDDIVLTGKSVLEFKWTQGNLARISHYEFKIYKGYNMLASTLILKQDVASGTYPIEVAVSLFEEGQVYTWSLRQVSYGGEKGDRSFSSFKIIKK